MLLVSLEPGKIVILLHGRFAGHKAVIVKVHESTKDRKYPHLIVAGVDRYPLQVTRGMSKRTISKRTRVKPFVKAVNVQHVMPTRFSMDIDLRGVVNASSMEPAKRKYAKRQVRKQFEAQHRAGKSQWMFEKLRF